MDLLLYELSPRSRPIYTIRDFECQIFMHAYYMVLHPNVIFCTLILIKETDEFLVIRSYINSALAAAP